MATIIPVVKVYGNGVLVKWVGLSYGDTGQEVDISSFKVITSQVSGSGATPVIQVTNDTSLPWITIPLTTEITERYRWTRVYNGTLDSSIDINLWCVN